MSSQKSVSMSGVDGGQGDVTYQGTPDECPMCHKGVHPRLVAAVILGEPNGEDSNLRIVFHQCTRIDCQETFLAYYRPRLELQGSRSYSLQRVAPQNPAEAAVSKSIVEVSPSFIEINNQAMAAEAFGLDQITGIGLRKALEFLIKDFLIHENPSKAEAIKKKFLGDCIRDDISDANVKACAARATWLANDETHYVRKWIGKDITDLKTLIRLTVNWIDNVLLTQEYLKEMDPTKPPEASPATSNT